MTARSLLSVVAFDMTSTDGAIVVDPGASVTVYEQDGTTLIAQSMYAAATGGLPLANPLTANNLGVATAYADNPQNCVVKVGGASYPAQFFINQGGALSVPTPVTLTQQTPSTVAAPAAGLDSLYPLTTGVWAHRANGGAEKTFVETTTTQTLTNKTLTSPVITGGTATSTTLTTTAVSDTLSLPDGAVATPSLFRAGDTNTGQWFPGSDQIAWSIAGVEAGRYRAGSFEAKVRDKGGFAANLEAFASGVTINNYQADGTGGDADSAWIAACAYLTSVGGGILEVGAGTFAAPSASVTWTNNIQIRGTYGKTTILHRPNSSQTPIIALGMTRFGLLNLIIDGNNNPSDPHNLTYAYPGAEVAITGTDVYVIGCTVRDFNMFGIQVDGTRVRVNDNTIYVNNGDGWPSPYPTLIDFSLSTGYRGYVGIATPGGNGVTGFCNDIEISRNMVSGLRGPAIFAGGTNVKIDGNICRNNHRTYCLTTGNVQTPGGQIALSLTDDGLGVGAPHAGTLRCNNFTISNNTIEAPPAADVVTFGAWSNGIELNACDDGIVSGNAISGFVANSTAPGLLNGITFDSTTNIKVSGGSVAGCSAIGLFVITNTSDLGVSAVNFHGNVTAVFMAGTTDNYAVQGCHFKGNTTANWNNTATGRNFDVTGNVTVDGDLVPEIRSMTSATARAAQILNDDINGDGLLIKAGTTSAEFALEILTRRGTANLLSLTGAATLRLGEAAGAARFTADLTHATRGNRMMFKTTTAASDSFLGVIPNGGTSGGYVAYAASDPDNAAFCDFVATASGALIRSSSTGTGTTQPIHILTAGTQRLSFETNGDIVPGTAALATNATAGFGFIETCAGPPTGTPTTYTGRIPMIYDSTNHFLYVYDSGWKKSTVYA